MKKLITLAFLGVLAFVSTSSADDGTALSELKKIAGEYSSAANKTATVSLKQKTLKIKGQDVPVSRLVIEFNDAKAYTFATAQAPNADLAVQSVDVMGSRVWILLGVTNRPWESSGEASIVMLRASDDYKTLSFDVVEAPKMKIVGLATEFDESQSPQGIVISPTVTLTGASSPEFHFEDLQRKK